jgi:prephenate dehydrogenase
MKKRPVRITIIGLGLIGGSIGLALRKADRSAVITGCSRRRSTARRAMKLGAINRSSASPAAAVRDADYVFICTPVRAVKDILKAIAPSLRRGCIVSDAASTKAEVMKWAKSLLPAGVNFIGGHPMAGKETSGIGVAEAGLFKGCTWCLAPGAGASRGSLQRLSALVRKLGARPLVIDPDRHDFLVAGISHLPFIMSSALVSAAAKDGAWTEMSRLASSGFRDATRLASGDSRLYTDICLTNRKAIASWLDRFSAEMERFSRMIAKGDENLSGAFSDSAGARNRWLKNRR